MSTKLYQLELDQTLMNCGMSYVFKLCNGRFIILDGGYFSPGEEDRLYRFLCERCNGTPEISAWFFSHAHQDHMGNFIQFIQKYNGSVKIEKLLYNFQPVDLSKADGDWKLKANDLATIKEFYSTINKYCNDMEIVTLRTGDKMKFGELTLDVLYTQEDLYPAESSFNDYSTVITTTVGGQKILWLGDIYQKGSQIMLNNPDILKCDIVQVAHHGNSGATPSLYAATEAKVVLWPTPDYMMEKIKKGSNEANNFLLHELNAKEHFISGNGTVEFSLPYEIGTAIEYKKEFSFEKSPK